MLKSGISIDDALTELGEQSNSAYLQKIIYQVRDDVQNGTPLSIAFGKETKIFGTIFVSLIKAGEESGTLQGNLQFLSEWLTRSADLKRDVAAATMYPKLVFGAAVLLGGSLTTFILPKLVPLFSSLDVELPLITRILLAISLFVQDYWLFCIAGVIATIVALVYINKIYAVRRSFHLFYLNLPFMGSMFKNYQLALMMQLCATLIKSGLSLNESVGIVSNAATSIQYQEALKEIQDSILKGTTLSRSMIGYEKLFPKIMLNIVAVGERSGTLVNSFEYLAEFYTKEVNAQTKKMPTIIEPLLLVFIAVVVGFIALAIIMPIYELTGNISK